MKLSALTPLNEIRIEDSSPKGFMEFLKKYRSLVRTKKLYPHGWGVHFSNYRESPMDKRVSPKQDHTDPAGIYAYPLEYVLKYPSDIWYGSGARFLHVVQRTAGPREILELDDILSNGDIHTLLFRMGISDFPNLDKIRRRFGHTGKWRYARTFMSAFQIDWSRATLKTDDMRNFMRPAQEQTALLRKAGYSVINDNNTGSIHQREPEQMIFLDRGSFKIAETFQIRDGDKKNPNNTEAPMTSRENDVPSLMRKIAAHVAQALGDRLSSDTHERANFGNTFWTKSGIRLEVKIVDRAIDWKMQNLSMGDKKHKMNKSHDTDAVNIVAHTPWGELEYAIDEDEKFKDAFASIARKYEQLKTERRDPDWTPENREQFLIKKEEMNEFSRWNYIRKSKYYEKPISLETFRQWKSEGKNFLGRYTPDTVSKLRDEHGLPEWEGDEYRLYLAGKIEWNHTGPAGPSRYSYGRLDRALKKRKTRDFGDVIERNPDHIRDLFRTDPLNPVFGKRTLAAINGIRKKNGVPPMTPEQYQKYLDNPSPNTYAIQHKYFPESVLAEKLMGGLPEEWPEGMWVHPRSGRFGLTDGVDHVSMIAMNPVQFGLPPLGRGTPFEKYCIAMREMRNNRALRDEMLGDPKLKRFMNQQGWVRTLGDESSLEVEANTLKDARDLLRWFGQSGIEIWSIASLDAWKDDKHVVDLDQEAVEALLTKGTLRRRFGEDDSEHYDALNQTGFWGRAGAGAIIIAKDTGRILLPYRSAHVEEPHTWGVWGGAIDPRENAADAARREIEEECGYHGKLEMHPAFVFQSGSFRYSNFIGVVEEEFKPKLNWESEGFRWVKPGAYPQPLHFGLKALLDDPRSAQLIKRLSGLTESLLEKTITPAFVQSVLQTADNIASDIAEDLPQGPALVRKIQNIIDVITRECNEGGKFLISRAEKRHPEQLSHLGSVGCHWSYDDNGARVYHGDNAEENALSSGYHPDELVDFIMYAEVNPRDVDWVFTVATNLILPGEREVTIRDGAKLLIYDVIPEESWKPEYGKLAPQKVVTSGCSYGDF